VKLEVRRGSVTTRESKMVAAAPLGRAVAAALLAAILGVAFPRTVEGYMKEIGGSPPDTPGATNERTLSKPLLHFLTLTPHILHASALNLTPHPTPQTLNPNPCYPEP
jgi:hypothetical protein